MTLPEQVRARADSTAQNEGCPLYQGVALFIRGQYNKGRRSGQLPPL